MKCTKLALIVLLAISVLTACGNDKDQLAQQEQLKETVVQDESVEVAAEAVQEEKIDSDFPVPIKANGEKAKFDELPEATQLAIQWTYDFFNTEDIETEDEFYDMMKAKYYQNVEVPPEEEMDISKEKFLFADYGSEMLPAFKPGQVVEAFEVWPEVPIGLNINVPIYVKIKGKDNLHAIAVSYGTDANRIWGADKNFPMALD